MAQYDLFKKTELLIKPIHLKNADLNEIAAAVAVTLGLPQNEVLVVDYLNDTLTLDVLRPHVDPVNIIGKQDQLLQSLARLPGVRLNARTKVASDGMLGWIAFDREPAMLALERTQKTKEEISHKLAKRAIVFSTGEEIAVSKVMDTNRPLITERLEAEGYSVSQGETLKDDREIIAARLRQAAYEEGYGLIITTGGVGAEQKDCTVEALMSVDSDASTPYICCFEKGTGRHMKDGVRIAVGRVSATLMVALPGPNDEVRASLDVLLDGLRANKDKKALSESLAANLRNILQKKIHGHPRY